MESQVITFITRLLSAAVSICILLWIIPLQKSRMRKWSVAAAYLIVEFWAGYLSFYLLSDSSSFIECCALEIFVCGIELLLCSLLTEKSVILLLELWFYGYIDTVASILFSYLISQAFPTYIPQHSAVGVWTNGKYVWVLCLVEAAALWGTYLTIQKKVFAKMSVKWFVRLMVIPAYFLDILGYFLYNTRYSNYLQYVLVGIITVLAVTVYYMYYLAYRQEKQEANRQIVAFIQFEYDYYGELRQKQEALNWIRHDLGNHLQVLQGMDIKEKNLWVEYKNRLIEYQKKLGYISYKVPDVRGSTRNEERKFPKYDILLGIILAAALGMSVCICRQMEGKGLLLILNWAVYAALSFQYLGRQKKFIRERNLELLKSKEGQEKRRNQKNCLEKSVSELEWEIACQLDKFNKDIPEDAGKKLLYMVDDVEKLPVTGSQVLDILLLDKLAACQEKQIIMKWELSLPKKLQIEEQDIISLFSNLLDNAIEAAAKAGQPRGIWIDTLRYANYWKITVRNSKEQGAHPVEENFLSGKAEKHRHGFGIRIIHYIAEKYEGKVYFSDAGAVFTVSIILKAF